MGWSGEPQEPREPITGVRRFAQLTIGPASAAIHSVPSLFVPVVTLVVTVEIQQ